MSTGPLIARVKDGRLVLDVPTDLPEGSEVELHFDGEEDEELLREIDASLEEVERGEVVDAEVVFADMRARRT